MPAPAQRPGPRRRHPRWVLDAARLDTEVYAAIAGTPSPALDVAMRRLSRAADYSRLSLAASAVLAAAAGPRGRRAAAAGLASVGATVSVVEGIIKPIGRRRRPDRDIHGVPEIRHVKMPISTSLPSGHSAGAFAFATGVGHILPAAGVPLRALAALVAYSRVHTGVHYPGDAIAGSLLGGAIGQVTSHALDHRWSPRER